MKAGVKKRSRKAWDGTQEKVRHDPLPIQKVPAGYKESIRFADYDAPHVDGDGCWCSPDIVECEECFGLGCLLCDEGFVIVHKKIA